MLRSLTPIHSGVSTFAVSVVSKKLGAAAGSKRRDAHDQEAGREVTLLFSVIALVAGIVLAYNALLLASGERRRFILKLVKEGAPDSMVIGSLAFDALILGLAGCVLGLIAGEIVSLYAYHGVLCYIAAAIPVGSTHIVSAQTV